MDFLYKATLINTILINNNEPIKYHTKTLKDDIFRQKHQCSYVIQKHLCKKVTLGTTWNEYTAILKK